MAEFIKWYLLYTSVCLAMAMLDACRKQKPCTFGTRFFPFAI